MDNTLACLAAWMPRQRWFAAKSHIPALRFVGAWDLPSDDAGARVRTLIVSDESTLPAVLYQVPVVARATGSVDAGADNVIGSPEPGTTLIDGPHDPAYARAILTLVTRGGEGLGAGTRAIGHAVVPVRIDDDTARVLSGEQSNTSLVFSNTTPPVICKVFRQLHPGLNPDIELQTALTTAGSPYVPSVVGSIEGEWPDSAGGSLRGSLAIAQEFLPDVADAWRVALGAAAAGADFAVSAVELGVATAGVHRALADLFPTVHTGQGDRESAVLLWKHRLATAVAEVPALADRRTAIENIYDAALTVTWPLLQRIHGDYHLGQVLRVADRGWMLLDFEGEPLRPMNERQRPDLALRDVAGMLRSFDYVAGSIRLENPARSPGSVSEWASTARRGFLAGYAATSGTDLGAVAPLLDALELDKAVYEAIYEARNRPTWIPIPLQAITRLVPPAL